MALATFASGCFWCTEGVFTRLKGVSKVIPGYCGGHVQNPSYKEVCTGTTGHAECCQITFDDKTISYDTLLKVFFRHHDPTQLNRQGNDIGTQYRSAIFYHNDEQRNLAEKAKQELDKSGAYSAPIVTEISPISTFYPAENYHHDYFSNNPDQPYCARVVKPKVEKFEAAFAELLK